MVFRNRQTFLFNVIVIFCVFLLYFVKVFVLRFFRFLFLSFLFMVNFLLWIVSFFFFKVFSKISEQRLFDS
jgi:hypothetical protein